ncbi:hypothetical protein OG985_47665 [Streptomyces sp. NBC_00289]|uniref:hypothetical protein n=1 Tax=Streptomyces sp. NBC_00289 TaxID=2975703 RepID=UPI0032467207
MTVRCRQGNGALQRGWDSGPWAVGTTVWESRAAACADVFHFIEVEYNRTRLRKHPDFGYLIPLETRALLQQDL